MEESVQVYCRIRPFIGTESATPDREGRAGFPVVEASEGTQLVVLDPTAIYKVKARHDFDACWGIRTEEGADPPASQKQVFSAVGPRCVSFAIDGMHTSVLTFGASGCGKSYTLFGAPDSEHMGLAPRILHALVDWRKTTDKQDAVLSATLVEVTMEKIYDLLGDGAPTSSASELKIRQEEGKGPFLPSVTMVPIDEPDAFLKKMFKVLKGLYANAVRPHVVLTFHLEQAFEFVQGTAKLTKRRTSRITLVDLATTDRATESPQGASQGVVLSAQDIAKNNKALFTLRRCVEALADKTEKSKAPFRDSALTWLLSDSIGGNCATHFVLCLSPFHRHLTESQSTLAFGLKARDVATKVRVNEDEETVKLREMRNEMSGLSQQLTQTSAAVTFVTQQLQQRSDKIEELSVIAEERASILRKVEKKQERMTVARLVRKQQAVDRLIALKREFGATSHILDSLREEVRVATDQRQIAEHSLREQEQARFRENGIEQDILSCIMEIEDSLLAVSAHNRDSKAKAEVDASKAEDDAQSLTALKREFMAQAVARDDAKKSFDAHDEKVRAVTAVEEGDVKRLRAERDRLVGMQTFNTAAIAEANDFIKQTEADIKRLTARKHQLEQENVLLNSGCQCLVM